MNANVYVTEIKRVFRCDKSHRNMISMCVNVLNA